MCKGPLFADCQSSCLDGSWSNMGCHRRCRHTVASSMQCDKLHYSQTFYNKTNTHSTLRTVPAYPAQATPGGVTAATLLSHSTLPQLLPPRTLSQQHQIMAHPKHTRLPHQTHTAATHAAQRGQNQHKAPHMPAPGVIGLERPTMTPMFSSREQHR